MEVDRRAKIANAKLLKEFVRAWKQLVVARKFGLGRGARLLRAIYAAYPGKSAFVKFDHGEETALVVT